MASKSKILVMEESWLTSASLFLLLNIIIGIITLTSKSLSQRGQDDHASSALRRLRSLSLRRLRSGDFFHNADEMSGGSPKKEDEQLFGRSQSDKVLPPAEKGEMSAMMMKSASERSVRGSFVGEKAVGEEVESEVDARADDFINKFRQQLRLQRLDSIQKYTEMLKRGK